MSFFSLSRLHNLTVCIDNKQIFMSDIKTFKNYPYCQCQQTEKKLLFLPLVDHFNLGLSEI